jgi:hypothetical protein
MKKPLIIGMGNVLVCAGCARQAARPDWVSGDSVQYPPSRYLLGRGQGDSQQVAADRARAELAKIFRVAISDETVDTEAVTTTVKDRKVQREQRAEAIRTVVTTADEVLEGIEIAKQWQDPQTQSHYALAVLPRARTAQSLRQRIAERDQVTEQYVAQARDSEDHLNKAGAIARALDSQRERITLQQQLAIVEASVIATEPRRSVAQLQAQLEEVVRQTRIVTRTGDDAVGGLQETLAGALAHTGFAVVDNGQAHYMAFFSLALDDLGKREGWYWLKGTLELRLSEMPGERMRGIKRWGIKVSAQQPSVAQQRALDQVSAILQQDLRMTILGFASGQ